MLDRILDMINGCKKFNSPVVFLHKTLALFYAASAMMLTE